MYQNIAGITFKSGGTESVEVDRIPVGAIITVKEVYSGSHYSPVGSTTVEGIVITAEEIKEAKFENKYGGRNGGHGIINEINYENGDWTSPQTTNSQEGANVE